MYPEFASLFFFLQFLWVNWWKYSQKSPNPNWVLRMHPCSWSFWKVQKVLGIAHLLLPLLRPCRTPRTLTNLYLTFWNWVLASIKAECKMVLVLPLSGLQNCSSPLASEAASEKGRCDLNEELEQRVEFKFRNRVWSEEPRISPPVVAPLFRTGSRTTVFEFLIRIVGVMMAFWIT